MSITLEIENFIIGRVASRPFRSASEVVRAALCLLEEDECRRETLEPRGRGEGHLLGR